MSHVSASVTEGEIVPFSGHLPNEVLRLIIHHTMPLDARSGTFEHVATLIPLRLSSRQFYEYATEVFYQDMFLSTPLHARRLLDSLRSKPLLDCARRTLRTIWFGRKSNGDSFEPGLWAGEVLAVVRPAKLQQVTFSQLEVEQPMLWTLTELPTLICNGARIDQTVQVDLPALNSLTLINTTISGTTIGRHTTLLKPTGLPSLIFLRVIDPRVRPQRQSMADRHAALRQLAPQLMGLEMKEHERWINPADQQLWNSFTSLKSLRLSEPVRYDTSVSALVPGALRHLGSSLTVLNVNDTGPMFAVTARNVLHAFEQNWLSVRKLKTIFVPAGTKFASAPGLTNFYQIAVLEKLVAVAESRGIEVVQV